MSRNDKEKSDPQFEEWQEASKDLQFVLEQMTMANEERAAIRKRFREESNEDSKSQEGELRGPSGKR